MKKAADDRERAFTTLSKKDNELKDYKNRFQPALNCIKSLEKVCPMPGAVGPLAFPRSTDEQVWYKYIHGKMRSGARTDDSTWLEREAVGPL